MANSNFYMHCRGGVGGQYILGDDFKLPVSVSHSTTVSDGYMGSTTHLFFDTLDEMRAFVDAANTAVARAEQLSAKEAENELR